MAYSIAFSGAGDGEDQQFFLCSIGSWGLFCKWAKKLSSKEYPALHGLVEKGEWEGTDRLGAELLDAAALNKPDDPGVLATLEALTEKVGAGDSEETVTITD